MATTITSTIREDGSGDYTTVAAWEAGQQRNLVSLDEIEHGKIQQAWTSKETTQVSFSGWTTDATRLIILEAEGAARHNGTYQDFAGGPWRLEHTGTPSLFGVVEVANLHFVDLIGLQVSLKDNSTGSRAPYATGTGGGGLRLRMDACIGRQDGNLNDANYTGLFLEGTVQLRNCLAHHINPQVGHWARGWGWVSAIEGAEQNLAYNCVGANFKGDATDAGGFFVAINSDNVLLINCIDVGSEGRSFFEATAGWDSVGSDFNASDKSMDAGADGPSSRNNQTFTFVNAAGNDFHLAAGDIGARGFGTDTTALATRPFADDIDGDIRAAFDIGMDEFQVPAGEVTVDASIEVKQSGVVQISADMRVIQQNRIFIDGSIQVVILQFGQVSVDASINVAQPNEVQAAASIQVILFQFGEVFVGAAISVIQRGQVQIASSLQPSFNGQVSVDASIEVVQRQPGQVSAQGSILVKFSGSIVDPIFEDNRVNVIEHGAQTEAPIQWRD